MPSRGARRRARRQHALRVASVAASVLMLALIVGTGLVVTGAVEVPGAGSTVAASHARTDPTTTTLPRATRPHHRALTTDDPLRLWIAGDSLAGSVGPSLGEQTAATGVVAPQYDSRVSSGLLNPSFFDWPKHAQEQLERDLRVISQMPPAIRQKWLPEIDWRKVTRWYGVVVTPARSV